MDAYLKPQAVSVHGAGDGEDAVALGQQGAWWPLLWTCEVENSDAHGGRLGGLATAYGLRACGMEAQRAGEREQGLEVEDCSKFGGAIGILRCSELEEYHGRND